MCLTSGYAAYWSLFNIEGESSFPASLITYNTLTDMLNDTNRIGVFTPTGTSPAAAANIIDSGSDGKTYWNLFNIEGESSFPASFITYNTLTDMLNDTNRIGVFTPTGTSPAAAANIVGSGADIAQITAVPEPSSLPLLCAGIFGFGLLLWIKRGNGSGQASMA